MRIFGMLDLWSADTLQSEKISGYNDSSDWTPIVAGNHTKGRVYEGPNWSPITDLSITSIVTSS